MNYVSQRASSRKTYRSQLDLFAWQPVIIFHPATYAARKLADLHGLSLTHATTIVHLAGIGGSEVGQ